MRITSGYARGISLESPRGDTTRPATDAARQAIFSSLSDAVVGASVLDVFAGTGSYGLEAISRGAAEATFVERDRQALIALKKNIENLKKSATAAGYSPNMNVMPTDCLKGNLATTKRFDLVFADPPYALLSEEKTLSKICAMFCKIADDNTLFLLEAPAEFSLPDKFLLKDKTSSIEFAFEELKRLGKKSKGKPSQIIFKIKKI